MEKALEFSIIGDIPKLYLPIMYAKVGRVQEARAMLGERTEKWPPSMKNVRWLMSTFTLKNLQTTERFAEGYITAGLPGESSGFYKISKDNRLTGDEIKELFFGQKVGGSNMTTGKPWWVERSVEGEAIIRDDKVYNTGKSWIEEDMLCDQWNNLYESLKDCWVIYRNPEGSPENYDEFLGAPGHGIYPFSMLD